ncbi:hypothetical protein B7494_g330 [Chlorociboria aeruginascens]|nr:hypothetical protein B7494_g330 [Chlorociboria aeruginascens]
MTLLLPIPFTSPTNPALAIQYTHLNPQGTNILVYCYGAGGTSVSLTQYQDLTTAHPTLSILCIERWVQGATASTSGLSLFSELSTLTLELLSSLHIQTFSIAAHSAGAYQALHLASCCPEKVKRLFPISTHIPASFTNSKIMNWMCTMPSFLFTTVTAVDQLDVQGTKAEKVLLSVLGGKKIAHVEGQDFVDSKSLRDLVGAYKPDAAQVALQKQRLDIDYRFGYCRVPGIGMQELVGLYRGCKVDATWFATNGDVFFGPESVHRMMGVMENSVELVVIEGATHADIFLRKEVWQRILEDMERV